MSFCHQRRFSNFQKIQLLWSFWTAWFGVICYQVLWWNINLDNTKDLHLLSLVFSSSRGISRMFLWRNWNLFVGLDQRLHDSLFFIHDPINKWQYWIHIFSSICMSKDMMFRRWHHQSTDMVLSKNNFWNSHMTIICQLQISICKSGKLIENNSWSYQKFLE